MTLLEPLLMLITLQSKVEQINVQELFESLLLRAASVDKLIVTVF